MSTRKVKFTVISILCIIAGIILMLLINNYDNQQTKNYADISGEKLGTGVPCNMLNTSGKIVKYNEDSFYYISKIIPCPGIYKETIDGNVSTLIVPEVASHLNIYRNDGDLDWLYYINDKNTLCRIREDGTHREDLVPFICNYLLVVDNILYYLTDDGNIWGVLIKDVP